MNLLYCFDNSTMRTGTICCDFVVKSKQYINILQTEASRLRGLQLECNELLDKFYPSKNEFDILVKDALQLKYFGENKCLTDQINHEEFLTFIKSVWQLAKYRFLEKGKNTKYMSFVGSPLAEVTSTIQQFVDETLFRLTNTTHHSECAIIVQSICNQIVQDLRGDCLSTAETCIRQYVYLQAAIPFLHEFKSLINQYLLSTDVHSPKEFLDQIINQITPVDYLFTKEDCTDMAPFRFMIDLLKGKLLDFDVLDHSSEITPVVGDDANMKRCMIVTETVNWIVRQYKTEDVPKAFKNFILPFDMACRKKSFSKDVNHFGNAILSHNTRFKNMTSLDLNDPSYQFDLSKTDWFGTNSSPTAFVRRVNRRGRRPESSNNEKNQANDLQPINLNTLQSPILRPLF